jgi:hypothetical protein
MVDNVSQLCIFEIKPRVFIQTKNFLFSNKKNMSTSSIHGFVMKCQWLRLWSFSFRFITHCKILLKIVAIQEEYCLVSLKKKQYTLISDPGTILCTHIFSDVTFTRGIKIFSVFITSLCVQLHHRSKPYYFIANIHLMRQIFVVNVKSGTG